ncbi:MAG: glycosyltransferase [Planctomycetota bacterium]|nr:MAG: glycosyltransferase [Planctomycetota bacterium]
MRRAHSGLRVALDYLPATTHWPGVGRYARELTRALVRLPPAELAGIELVLFEWGSDPRVIGEPWIGLAGFEARVRRVNVVLPRRALEWRAYAGFDAAWSCGPLDLFHRIHAHYPPLRKVRQLLPVPELRADPRLRARCAAMAGLLVASAHAAQRLTGELGVAPERIHHVSTGCEHWAREQREPIARREPAQVLVLGALRSGRGHAALLEAFARLAARGRAARLLFVGPDGIEREPLFARAAALGVRESVEWIGHAIEEQMPRVMAESAALAHVSDGELTPVTPLEAFASGTAVLASPLPAFQEALGDAATWAPAEAVADAGALAALLERAIESGLDARAAEARRAIAARFTWAEHARKTVAAWRRVAADPT